MPLRHVRERAWHGIETRRLTLVVGASPLPNLVAAAALAPAEVALICSEQTSGPAKLLLGAIQTHVPNVSVVLFNGQQWLTVPDPHAPVRIRATLAPHVRRLADGILFYTGGTKAMATHIHGTLAACAARGSRELRACYLSDSRGQLIFDDGYEASLLEDVSVGLEQLATLHGLSAVELRPPALDNALGEPTNTDAEILCAWVLNDPSRATALYEALSDPTTNRPVTASQLKQGGASSRACLDGMPSGLSMNGPLWEVSNSKAAPWIRFLRGTWVEPIAGGLMQHAASGRETARSVRATIARSGHKSLEFELDIAQVAGARLYAVSCTTGHTAPGERSHTKLKVFEVGARARQLGGQLARSAVFSLHPADMCVDLERDVAAVWEGDEPQPRVFGVDDMREWRSGQLGLLAAWLNS